MSEILTAPGREVVVDIREDRGALEWWRAALSHGGINTHPLPERVRQGIARLRPRLIRIFIQEHFAIYPERGQFDWSLLDPYMESLAATGAKVAAAITVKPTALFPVVDHARWRPGDVAEWQRVIFELGKRYSVEKPIVSQWEIGNETDIGEHGGSPFLIPDPDDYFEWYRMTTAPLLRACPDAKVGGPAACWVDNEPLPGLVERCARSGERLDFISWHLYHDDPRRHALGVEKAKRLLEGFPGPRPEMLVTEWSKSFDPVSCEELAFSSRRAATITAGALAMLEAGLDWSCYYHIWDQVFYPELFAPFFSPAGIEMMVHHWNEAPHRFGMFGVEGEARPHYFAWQMLTLLGERKVSVQSSDDDLHALAGVDDGAAGAMVVNLNPQRSRDLVVTMRFLGLEPGRKQLVVYRIDRDQRWSQESLELLPAERREVVTRAEFPCQVFCPADSVTLVTLRHRHRG